MLEVRFENFDAWNTTLIEVTTEKNCKNLLKLEPNDDDPIRVKQHKKHRNVF